MARNTGQILQKKQHYRVKKRGRLFVFMLVLLLGGIYLLLNSSYFDVADISVVGNDRFTDEEIITLSGLQTGGSIFRINEPAAKQGVERNPYLVAECILRQYPNRLVIQVRERVPVLCVEYMGQYFLADRELVLLERVEQPTQLLVKGLVLRNTALGLPADTIDGGQRTQVCSLLTLMEAAGFLNEVDTIDFTQTNSVFFTAGAFTALLGLPVDLQTKLSYFLPARQAAREQGNTGGTLDISVPESIVFLPPESTLPQSTPENGD